MNSKKNDYGSLITRIEGLSATTGVETDILGVLRARGDEYPIYKVSAGRGGSKRALISGGIHGDEPAGVYAICELLEQKLWEKFLPDWELVFLPCLNPTGFETSTRANHSDKDLNRGFREASPQHEVAIAQSAFSGTGYTISLELHEDVDSHGFYLYQKESNKSDIGFRIVRDVRRVLPINEHSEIEGMPADLGVIHRLPDYQDMEWWPMAVYSFDKGTKTCLTLETPGKLSLDERVRGHLAAVQAALSEFRE